MSKCLGVALAALTVFGLSAGAMAAEQNTRVRGTIESVEGNTLAMQPYNGGTVNLTLSPRTKFASVLPSSLSDIKAGDFIGAGATGPENDLKALEVVIFPESMRGAGEGHYAWSVPAAVAAADTHANTNAGSGAPPVQGTMTNGTVASTSSETGAPPVQGTMTNGTVAANTNKLAGTELTVTYNNGKKVQILVPPDAPVVRFEPAERSALKPGAKAFAVATKAAGNNEPSARFVAVGENGLMPPM